MKAEEVQRRYAAGERNFSGANLRGQNFKGQNLSGANFSHADIRGANFTAANLSGANFTGAKAGVRKFWLGFQAVISLSLALALAFTSVSFIGIYASGLLSFQQVSSIRGNSIVTSTTVLLIFVITISAIAIQGLNLKAVMIAAPILGIGICFILLVAIFSTNENAVTATKDTSTAIAAIVIGGGVSIAIPIAAVIALAITIGVSISNAIPTITTGILGFIVGATLAISGNAVLSFGVSASSNFVLVLSGGVQLSLGLIVSAYILLFSSYVAWCTLQEDERFLLVRTIATTFGAIGGTNFNRANLTDANFTGSTLKSTNFHGSNLTRVCWKDAKKLNRARVGYSILFDASVRELLVSRNGYKKSYAYKILRGANLDGVNLNLANLKQVDLSGATLRQADLRDANLTEATMIETNFTGASFTGACLQAWNIDHTTKLENIDCQFVFLLEKANERGDRERRPHDPKQMFQTGDFEKLYREVINTVQILLRNGLNREAFAEAFQMLMTKHENISFDSIQAIEKKGDDVLLTIEVPEAADKAKIAQDFLKPYEDRVRQLEAQVDRLTTLHSTDIKEIALAIAQRPITITNQVLGEGTMQETNDSSRKIEIGSIGRDFNASGQSLNLGDISGTVTNAINQLPSSAEGDRLKDLLIELQAAIESDPQLPADDKQTALEQVKELAAAGQEPDAEKKRSIGKRATQMLKGIAASLPDATSLVEACAKLLPLITPLIGL